MAWIGALAALTLARPQYIAFGLVPLLVMAFAGRRGNRGVLIAATIGFASAVALQSQWMARWPSFRAASNYDFYLGAVLPAVHDERLAISTLGLPPDCRNAIGSNWFADAWTEELAADWWARHMPRARSQTSLAPVAAGR